MIWKNSTPTTPIKKSLEKAEWGMLFFVFLLFFAIFLTTTYNRKKIRNLVVSETKREIFTQ